MNKVTTKEDNVPAQRQSNPYLDYGNSAIGTRIIGKLLKFSKFGEFKAGEDDIDIPLGTEMVAHMTEFHVGWVRWDGQKPVEHRMGRLEDNFQPPRRGELGDDDKTLWETDDKGIPRDPWQFSNYLIMMDRAGELYTFSTSSAGGLQAIGHVVKAYGARLWNAPQMFPIMKLGMRSYDHPNKAYGEIRNPVLEIIGWTHRHTIDEVLEAATGQPSEAGGEQTGQNAIESQSTGKTRLDRALDDAEAETELEKARRKVVDQTMAEDERKTRARRERREPETVSVSAGNADAGNAKTTQARPASKARF